MQGDLEVFGAFLAPGAAVGLSVYDADGSVAVDGGDGLAGTGDGAVQIVGHVAERDAGRFLGIGFEVDQRFPDENANACGAVAELEAVGDDDFFGEGKRHGTRT